MSDIVVPTQDFAAAGYPVDAPALTASDKLELLALFPSIWNEAQFAHAATIYVELDAQSNDGRSSERTLMDYAVALRKRAQENPDLVSSQPDYELSRDLFKFIISKLSSTKPLPDDVKDQPLYDFFKTFADALVYSGPHAYYNYMCFKVIEKNPMIPLLLDEEKNNSPEFRDTALKYIHSNLCAYIDIDVAEIKQIPGLLTTQRSGRSSVSNLRTQGNHVTANHHITYDPDDSGRNLYELLFHESNHTYQQQAQITHIGYLNMLTEFLSHGKSEEEARDYMEAYARGQKDEDIPFLLKQIYMSEEFRFFAKCMHLAASVYPEDTITQLDRYVANPLEAQAFNTQYNVGIYLAADPEQRKKMRDEMIGIFLTQEHDEKCRHELKAALLKEIDDEAKSQPTASMTDNKPVAP